MWVNLIIGDFVHFGSAAGKNKKKNNLEESGPLRLAKTVFELDKHPF